MLACTTSTPWHMPSPSSAPAATSVCQPGHVHRHHITVSRAALATCLPAHRLVGRRAGVAPAAGLTSIKFSHLWWRINFQDMCLYFIEHACVIAQFSHGRAMSNLPQLTNVMSIIFLVCCIHLLVRHNTPCAGHPCADGAVLPGRTRVHLRAPQHAGTSGQLLSHVMHAV